MHIPATSQAAPAEPRAKISAAKHFAFLADLLRRRSGLVIGEEKLYLLETRLEPLLRRVGLPDLNALAGQLASTADAELEQAVAEAMATHETLFFRDSKPFEHLQSVGLPMLLSKRPSGTTIRVWSAATATGQEAYSIAMTALETGLDYSSRVSILGSDLASPPIQRAKQGLYSQYEVQRGLSIRRLLHHFTQEPDGWQVRPILRSMCDFRQWNLLDDPAPLGRFDIIFCRNVLMYLDQATRKRVLSMVLRQLAPDGLLYLGLAETSGGIADILPHNSGIHAVFQPNLAAA